MNLVAKSTVGVYLIHEHPGMRVLLWQRWFPFDGVYGSGLFILASLLVPTAILVGCLAADMGRRALFRAASRSVKAARGQLAPTAPASEGRQAPGSVAPDDRARRL